MIFIAVILLGIIIGYPIWDYFYMKRGDFSNKRKMYLTTMFPQWIIVAVLYIFWFFTHRSWKALFEVKNPLLASQMENIQPLISGVLTTIIGVFLFFLVSKKKRNKLSKWLDAQTESVQFMLPITFTERFLFFMVAITAGFSEEVIFRGVMLYELEHLPVVLTAVMMIVIDGLLFGIVHLYQGCKGVLGTGYVGAIFFYLYLVTGNLWTCILLHFLIDVKFAFTPNRTSPKESTQLTTD